MNSYHVAWASLNWLTITRLKKIEGEYWDLSNAFNKIDRKFLEKMWERKTWIEEFLDKKSKLDLIKQEEFLKKYNTKLLYFRDELYPENLKFISDPPIFLYCQWDLLKEDALSLAAVWSRKMSDYWKQIAKEIIFNLPSSLVIVSWFALWVDTLSHEIALSNWARTIWVLWTWLDIVYPSSNRGLRDRIINEKAWVLITEFPFWERPERFNFPKRNRIIAWMTMWTLVIEARQKSWSLITAKQALDYNREVFACPWSIISSESMWTNEMIKKWEAKLVQTSEDILVELGIWIKSEKWWGFRNVIDVFNWGKDEMKVYSILWKIWKDYSQIVNETWFTLSKISSILIWMEIKWVVENVGMGVWIVKK